MSGDSQEVSYGKKEETDAKNKPKNEFRYNVSNIAMSHPHYIFGETANGKYKSLGLTHTPDEKHRYYPYARCSA